MRNIYDVNYMDDKNIDERIKNICLQAENNYILNYSKTQDDKKIKNEISEKIKMNLNSNDDMSSFLDKTMTYSKDQNDNKNFYENKQQNEIFSNYNSNNNEYNLNNNESYSNSNEYNLNKNEYNKNINKYTLNKKNYEQNINKYSQDKNNYNPNINNYAQDKNNYNQNNNSNYNLNNINNNNYIRNNNNYNRNNNNFHQNNNKYINIRSNEIINKKALHSRNTNTFKINKHSNISQELINSMNNKIKYISNNMISPKSFNDEDIVNYNSQLILSQSEIGNHNHNHNGSNFFSSSSSFCFECDLQKLINDKNIYNKDLNIKAQQNKEINKIILKAKTLLVKNKLKKAYDLLNLYLNSNIQNPDLYYLYGETCRKLKFMEDAEKYLLDCMNFKNCSPYVYLSLAELYREIGQIKYSKQFYKKCLLYFNSKGNIYYNLAINYMKLNKPIKALNFITEAIDLDNNIPSYYKLRSDIYKNLGHKDLSEKDLYQYNILINK